MQPMKALSRLSSSSYQAVESSLRTLRKAGPLRAKGPSKAKVLWARSRRMSL